MHIYEEIGAAGYISGPMTGKDNLNYGLFNEVTKILRDQFPSQRFINPAEQAGGDQTLDYTEYMRWDVQQLLKVDYVVLLPDEDWLTSKGCHAEVTIALALGLPVFKFSWSLGSRFFLQPLELPYCPQSTNSAAPAPATETILEEAQRLVHGDRGDSYGHPMDDFTRTGKFWAPILGLEEVTPEQVALCMTTLKISRELNKPKRDNRVDAAGYLETLDMIRARREDVTT